MNEEIKDILSQLIDRYPILKAIETSIKEAFFIMKESYENYGKLLIAGNGGSSSDADHIVGELMKGFVLDRKLESSMQDKMKSIDFEIGNELSEKLQKGLPAISLSNHNSLNTAYLNDVDGDFCFAQQVNGYGKQNDVFLGITTSGNSKNILNAAVTAKAKGMKVIGLTGKDGGRLNKYTDVNIIVPENETYKIQELHLPVYHCLCLMLEKTFFGEGE